MLPSFTTEMPSNADAVTMTMLRSSEMTLIGSLSSVQGSHYDVALQPHLYIFYFSFSIVRTIVHQSKCHIFISRSIYNAWTKIQYKHKKKKKKKKGMSTI